jgi:hypothetical protein
MLIDTLEASGAGHIEAHAEEGHERRRCEGRAKVSGNTRGSESGRGERVSVRGNTFIGTTDSDLE